MSENTRHPVDLSATGSFTLPEAESVVRSEASFELAEPFPWDEFPGEWRPARFR